MLYSLWGRAEFVVLYFILRSTEETDRVLSFPPVVRIGTPPHTQAKVYPPPFGWGGGHTRLREKGVGGSNSNEGTDTVVL